MHAPNRRFAIWPVPLARIDTVVSAHLGPGGVPGNAQAPCFSRQVSMYLAKHVGGWSLSQIGKFYNGRHHTTVLHAIAKIERFIRSDESVDALIEVLTCELAAGPPESLPALPEFTRSALVEAVATRVMDRLAQLEGNSVPKMAERLIGPFSNEVRPRSPAPRR